MRTWLITVPLILVLGSASAAVAGLGGAYPWFFLLRKPWFMPPVWAFPLVWTTLYILMGVALARVIDRPGLGRTLAIALFAVQLALNLAWPPLFFAAHRMAGALALVAVLDAAVVATIVAFARVDRPAAAMLLPYVAWLAVATALNAAILRLNA